MRRVRIGTFVLSAVVVASFVGAGCSSSTSKPEHLTVVTTTTAPAAFGAGSPAFSAGGSIPKRYTCDGSSISPPLRWSDAPANTKQVALIVEDPDAPGGTFVHWVIWGLSPTGSMSAGAHPSTAVEGVNGSGRLGYTGPCPPSGLHHYRFTFYAVSEVPDVHAGATATQLRQAIDATTLAATSFVGTYRRG